MPSCSPRTRSPCAPESKDSCRRACRQACDWQLTTSTTRENVETIFRHVAGGRIKDAFEVIGDGDRVRAKKPSPDIYVWTLNELGLAPQGVPRLRRYAKGRASKRQSRHHRRRNSHVLIPSMKLFRVPLPSLSDMGENQRPFRVISGNAHGRHYVDIDLLRLWHRGAHPQLLVTS